MPRRRPIVAGVLLLLLFLAGTVVRLTPESALALPEKLSDEQFWELSEDLSEPNGSFRSNNLLSNEIQMQHVIPDLVRAVRPGTAYLGVGPEQNFTYVAALKPAMVFIVDIRRGNLQLHLLYKALFELSADRGEFVSRLFSKKRPPGVTAASSAEDLVKAFWNVETSDALYKENLAAAKAHLTRTRGLPLGANDLQGIESVYYAFYWFGPSIQYTSDQGRGGGNFPTYAQLMTATDGQGIARGFLSSEDRFKAIKQLHAKNLIVPVVGDFAGPKALRAVGRFLKDRESKVGAFYLSNVEQYLSREGKWETFCKNVATLPRDSQSTFIRAVRNGDAWFGMGLTSVLGNIGTETRSCAYRH